MIITIAEFLTSIDVLQNYIIFTVICDYYIRLGVFQLYINLASYKSYYLNLVNSRNHQGKSSQNIDKLNTIFLPLVRFGLPIR